MIADTDNRPQVTVKSEAEPPGKDLNSLYLFFLRATLAWVAAVRRCASA